MKRCVIRVVWRGDAWAVEHGQLRVKLARQPAAVNFARFLAGEHMASTSLSASTASAFIDASRRVHLRVTPSSSRPTSGQPSGDASRLSLVTRD